MACEERLVACHILHCYYFLLINSNDLVHQLHWVAVRQERANLVDIHERSTVGVVCGALHLMLLDVPLYCARELIIYCMARLCCYDTSEDGLAHKSEVANDVEQLMSSRLIAPSQRLVVDIAKLGSIHSWYAKRVSQLVISFLRQLPVVDDNGVVEVASLDEPEVEQRLYLSDEDKCASGGYLSSKVIERVEVSKLIVENLRVERDLSVDTEMVVRQENEMFPILALNLHLLLYHIIVLFGILLLQTHLLYLFDDRQSASVKDGHLRTIKLDEAVVNATGIEGSHGMLDCAYLYFILYKYSASLRIAYQLGIAVDDGLTFEVCALDLISMILACRTEDSCDVLSCMQAFALQGK